jgi:hypothetical protein
MTDATERPPLTVTIATNDGWETVRQAYDPLRGQAEARGVEVLLVDGSRGSPPAPGELGPTTRWIEMPGADIAEMRMRGYREAKGDLIAMIEDHVIVPPDWVETVINAHAEHTEAAAVGGGVKNGTPRHLIDWASFYAGHAPYIAPLPSGPAEFLEGAYVAYKRQPLQSALNRLGDRAIETLINEEIKAAGGTLFVEERLYVTHLQSRGIAGTTRLHYHAGRHFEGTRRASRRNGPMRLVRAVVLPVPRMAKRLATARQRGEPIGRLARVAPAMFVVFSAQAAGEIVGIVRGPGRAATKIH